MQSFIDTIGTHDNFVRGGTLAPTVKIDLEGDTSAVDYSYGNDGLGGWARSANQHLFTNGKYTATVSDATAEKIREVVGGKFDDFMQGKPVPAPIKALIERLIAQYGG